MHPSSDIPTLTPTAVPVHGAAGEVGDGVAEEAGDGPGPVAGWIDTHCHLDAPEFDVDRTAVWASAQAAGVQMAVLPAVLPAHFAAVRELAHRLGVAYALGTHPLYVAQVPEDQAVAKLAEALERWGGDPHLVAVGEIGLDHFVPGVDHALQARLYQAQLRLARRQGLPVIVHVRRSADALLHGLRRQPVVGGIVHAFNGSVQQAHTFVKMGFALGFGGAMTFERALHIRQLAQELPEHAIVLETDAPDIPPQWLYRTAQQRAEGQLQGRNAPAELPRIGQHLARLRGWSLHQCMAITRANAVRALPRLAALMPHNDLIRTERSSATAAPTSARPDVPARPAMPATGATR